MQHVKSKYISAYGGKIVIATSNVTVSLSQVSLIETEELNSREFIKMFGTLWCNVSRLPTTNTWELTCSDRWKHAYQLLLPLELYMGWR